MLLRLTIRVRRNPWFQKLSVRFQKKFRTKDNQMYARLLLYQTLVLSLILHLPLLQELLVQIWFNMLLFHQFLT